MEAKIIPFRPREERPVLEAPWGIWLALGAIGWLTFGAAIYTIGSWL